MEHTSGIHETRRAGIHFEPFWSCDGPNFDAVKIVHVGNKVLKRECVMVLVVNLDDEAGSGACCWVDGLVWVRRRDGECFDECFGMEETARTGNICRAFSFHNNPAARATFPPYLAYQ